ncbi:hypothetical protein P256_00487 [Acinetobacter nectaris CIP 110549]|uniref:HTH tetR-type domain-containing protein n=1 Tax=Acinetobacter nectaris CIP 110549 TaxID=1392540 RepID=V2TBN5_9GAMM|nr:TetR/AcrR family transcriptional regulator [Acinetobacter nectaris]ESK40048.1 hypothetical protein P256_00487 [Acinetobacter nectaris CIP 110549]
MGRQTQFQEREATIFRVAEKILLEDGEVGFTLDLLAAELDLAKGTLYKHFKSKNELYMLLLLAYEKSLLAQLLGQEDKKFSEKIEFFVLYHLNHSEKTVLYHLLEEKLAANATGLQNLFAKLYQIRKQRLKIILLSIDAHLTEEGSKVSSRDYIALVWSLVYGACMLLNSSFYQRYLGSRETLKRAYVKQVLKIPKIHR